MRRTPLTVLTAVLATAAALAAPAEAAAPTVDLQPQQLPRGADVAVPHVDDGVFVDGDRRIDLPGDDARVLGASDDGAWLAATWRTTRVGEQRGARVVRVRADGTVGTVLVGFEALDALLSEDGSRLVTVGDLGRRRAAVTVRSATDGAEVASRTFRGYPEVLTADDRRVLVRTAGRTAWWRVGSDRVRTLTRGLSGPASIEHDLFVTYTEDPYLGGCSRLVRLSDLATTLWRSCRQRVAAFSPDGTQVLSFHILTDGVGPGEIHLRTVRGTRLATWTTGWFGGWGWESPGTVLLRVNGRRTASVVRCTLARCENATDPVRVAAP
ncbi:hypothetical protein [Nocardioides xinjiangensis]|uniref:hypothetical protein n=1 Tax=Nocardioides xinjiangensis TaxID=2817376 RepID=UPI001B30920E|nr:MULTISPECIES: hypothetical protein [unclassified Nocardioides]